MFSNIDVLLRAADFLEHQHQGSSSTVLNENSSSSSSSSTLGSAGRVSISPFFLGHSSSLSPPLSCYGSPTSQTCPSMDMTHGSSSSNGDEPKAYHKKFNYNKSSPTKFLESTNTTTTTSTAITYRTSSQAQSYPNVVFPSPASSTSSSYDGELNNSCSSSGSISNKKNCSSSSSKMSMQSAALSNVVKLEDMRRDKALHNTLEKNRRAHLKECFENLQNELPQYKDKKATNLSILNYTVKYVDQYKRKEKENEIERMRLIKRQSILKNALSQLIGQLEAKNFDYSPFLKQAHNGGSSSQDSSKSELLAQIDRLEESLMANIKLEIDANYEKNYSIISSNNNNNDSSFEDESVSTHSNDYGNNVETSSISSSRKAPAFSDKKKKTFTMKLVGQNYASSPIEIKYQRKRSSNSLNLPSINLSMTKPLGTKLIKLSENSTISKELLYQKQQQKQMEHESQSKSNETNSRHRHLSVDDNIIQRTKARRKKQRSINVCDDNAHHFEFDHEMDEDYDLDMDSDYDDYEDDDEEYLSESESELVINEDPATSVSTSNSISNSSNNNDSSGFSRSISNNSSSSTSSSSGNNSTFKQVAVNNKPVTQYKIHVISKQANSNSNLEHLMSGSQQQVAFQQLTRTSPVSINQSSMEQKPKITMNVQAYMDILQKTHSTQNGNNKKASETNNMQ